MFNISCEQKQIFDREEEFRNERIKEYKKFEAEYPHKDTKYVEIFSTKPQTWLSQTREKHSTNLK